MKKIFSIIIIAVLVAACAAFCSACSFTPPEENPSQAEDANENEENTYGAEYQLSEDGDTAYLQSVGNFSGSEFTVAATYKGKPVTRIDSYAFSGKNSLKRVNIPEGVTEIGSYAFSECENLERIDLPKSVTYLGESVFSCCNALKIHYAGTVDEWAQITFDGALECADLYINGAPVTEINLTTAEKVGDYAFSGLSNLKSVTLGDSVKEIGQMAFIECTELKSVTLSSSVTKIGSRAFELCTKMKNFTIPDGVTEIGYSVFDGCSSLIKIEIPDGVETIPQNAFLGCYALTSVKLGKNVKTIEDDAFGNCYKLVEIINESGIKISKDDANGGIGKNFLTTHKGESKIKNVNDYLFITCKTSNDNYQTDNTYLLGYTGDDKDLVFPSAENGQPYNVYGYAFYERTDIKSVDMQGNAQVVMWHAFHGCSSLKKVTLGDNTMSFGDYAFYDCESLSTITLPETVTHIGKGVFYGCIKLAEVVDNSAAKEKSFITTDGGSKDSVKSVLYVHKGESEIKEKDGFSFITVNGSNYLIDYYGTDENVNLPQDYNDEKYVIFDCAFRNYDFIKSVTFSENITRIGDQAFENCRALTSVELPSGVERIGSGAFKNCTSLESVKLPDTVRVIASGAFEYDEALKKVNYIGTIEKWATINFVGNGSVPSVSTSFGNPTYYAGDLYINDVLVEEVELKYENESNILSISPYAFYNCRSIKSVEIDGVSTIARLAFSGCTGITSVTLSNSVEYIGGGAFENCTGLTSITLPVSVKSIGESAFYGCKALKSVIIEKNEDVATGRLTSIVDNAFYESGLESINLPVSVKAIGEKVFCNCSVEITYDGTTEQWGEIVKSSDWSEGGTVTVVCLDGRLETE